MYVSIVITFKRMQILYKLMRLSLKNNGLINEG
jgi:hypothetical protein